MSGMFDYPTTMYPDQYLDAYVSTRKIDGFSDWEVLRVICGGESSFDPLIDNINSSARGWWQHMGKYWIRTTSSPSRPERWFPDAPPAPDGVVANIHDPAVSAYGGFELYYHEGGARHWAAIYNYSTQQFRDYGGIPASRYRRGPDERWTLPPFTPEEFSYEQIDPFFRPRHPTINANGDRDWRGDGKVSTIQTQLSLHGFNIAIDGLFGNGTKSTVEAFQASVGLAVDGLVGPETKRALGMDPTPPPEPPPSTEEIVERLAAVERQAANADQRSKVNRGAIEEVHGWPV